MLGHTWKINIYSDICINHVMVFSSQCVHIYIIITDKSDISHTNAINLND